MDAKYQITFRNKEYWLPRTTAADKSDDVKIVYVPSRDRHSYNQVISGQEDDVLDHVAWIIQHEPYQFMYEHLSWSVIGIDQQDGITSVRLYRSSYAGD